jgi:uncharacterized membrane protein YphA (DoxX/SURF4 family)
MSISNYLDSVAKPFEGLAPWILRLVLGVSFILHGLGKFPLPPEKMVTWFESMGIAAPEVVASLVAVGEVWCWSSSDHRWFSWWSGTSYY